MIQSQSYQKQDFINNPRNEIEALREWLKKQPHLPDSWDDVILTNFLQYCKFSLEKTKKKLEMYFSMKTATPEYFVNRDIRSPELQNALKFIQIALLPPLSGNPLCLFRHRTTNLQELDYQSGGKLMTMYCDIHLKTPQNLSPEGMIFIVDASAAFISNFLKIPPTAVRSFFHCAQEAYPFRIKKVHIINPTPLVDTIFKWTMPFVKDKIKARMQIHEDVESLFHHVPKELLPQEFGGTAGKMEEYVQDSIKVFEKEAAWFQEQEGLKSDESKRVKGVEGCLGSMFAVEGSFKQLQID